MERRKIRPKNKTNLESLFFATPEQKLLRFVLSEPTTSFTPRVLSSRLKGVRGLGGVEGIVDLLKQYEEIGMVNFLDNNRSIMANNDNLCIKLLKTLSAICDLESIRELCAPYSEKGILYGDRAAGASDSESEYDLFIVTNQNDEVNKIISSHPLGRRIELKCWKPDEYLLIERKDPSLASQLNNGIALWGAAW